MEFVRIKAHIIPAAGQLPNFKRDALEARNVLRSDGVIIDPTDVDHGTYLQHNQLHILSDDPEEHQRRLDLTHALTKDMGATLGIMGKLRADHPRLQQLSTATLARLSDEGGLLMVGSSANLTGQGQKYRVEDIEPEVLEAVDLVVDYGLQKWQLYRKPGSSFDFYNMKLLRVGANYEVFRERMQKWAGMVLPEDPEHKTNGVKPVGISINA
ncbi:hypothetical protein PMIN01_06884 [Paraphaeosphaeria minitans]|uniref:Uncharacterized protein n=1 Tax=Paraphaeosphaeria minitans TaxID=565426 RepID=A0A9P6GHH4_9PLEO|nr:hypothetical protein PMIN01_06884 [Paraphaeosphaeria minitans]